jgi:hypothetical protein
MGKLLESILDAKFIKKMKNRARLIFLILLSLAGSASSTGIETVACTLLLSVWNTVRYAAVTLVGLMFVYGGLKYVHSAEDAAGRRAGKKICEHAVIGGIIIGLVRAIAVNIGINTPVFLCPGITP